MTVQTTLPHDIVTIPMSNHSSGRAGKRVCKITPHHAAMVGATSRQVANVFVSPARQASANYCIGNDGSLTLTVGEEDRAWTSSSPANDNQAVTIEVANAAGAPTWAISDAAWKTLVALCVDICKRYGFRLDWTGNANGSLTVHRMFTATACPGPDLYSHMPALAAAVNAALDGKTDHAPTGNFDGISSAITVRGWCADPMVGYSVLRAKCRGVEYDHPRRKHSKNLVYSLRKGGKEYDTQRNRYQQVAADKRSGHGGLRLCDL